MKFPAALVFALAAAQIGLSAPLAKHPAPGTSLTWFAKVDDGVYKGSKPRREADYQFLESQGIRYIVQLHFLPFLSRTEKRKARQHGMTLISIPMNASPIPPSEKHVDQALAILHDKRYHPVYFHCVLGHDRTSMIAALYEMCFKGLPPKHALSTMREYGYKHSWILYGLKSYVEKAAKRAQEGRSTDCGRCGCATAPAKP